MLSLVGRENLYGIRKKENKLPSREASLRNLEKARAAWSHPPRPWRNLRESRVIEQLTWQWFNAGEPGKWSGRAVARWLGVSHTYVQKLVRKFGVNPDRMRRIQAAFGPATFDKLERARAFKKQHEVKGYLRGPNRFRLAKFQIGSNVVRAVLPTKAEERRRAAAATGKPIGPTYVPIDELPPWANPQSPWKLLAERAMENQRPWRGMRLARRWRSRGPFY